MAVIVIVSVLAISVSAVTPTYDVSNAYRKSKYYDNLKAVTLTGDQVNDVLAIAMSQLGYHEGDGNSDLGGLNDKGVRDFVEYNVLYGAIDNQQGNGLSYGYSWCASFVNWCLRQAGVSVEASAAAEVSCRRWLSKCKSAGIYNEKNGYIPQAGDLIFFKDEDSEVSSTHIGLVLTSDGKKVYTIEGNTSNGSEFSRDGNYVATKKYSLNSEYIVGYASPKYERDPLVPYTDCLGKGIGRGLCISTDTIDAFSSKELGGEKTVIEQYTVFTVKSISGGVAKIKYNKDGKNLTLWAKIDGKAVQLEGERSDISVSYVSGDGELLFTQYGTAGDEMVVAGACGSENLGGFVGWRLNMGEIDLIFRPGAEFRLGEENLSLCAIWDHEIYEVSFKDQDGNVISNDRGYFGDDVDVPAVSVPEGYYFAGWLEGDVSDTIRGNAVYTAVVLEGDADTASAEDSQTASAAENESDANENDKKGCRAGFMWGELLIALSAAIVAFGIKGKRP
jgi:hypothetical protein